MKNKITGTMNTGFTNPQSYLNDANQRLTTSEYVQTSYFKPCKNCGSDYQNEHVEFVRRERSEGLQTIAATQINGGGK